MPENASANVRIPFLNKFTAQYSIKPGPLNPECGNGRHSYRIFAIDDQGNEDWSMDLHFQEGALNTIGHNGVLNVVLIQCLIDNLESFQAGDYPDPQTAIAITKLEEAQNALCRRADERHARGVLGRHKK